MWCQTPPVFSHCCDAVIYLLPCLLLQHAFFSVLLVYVDMSVCVCVCMCGNVYDSSVIVVVYGLSLFLNRSSSLSSVEFGSFFFPSSPSEIQVQARMRRIGDMPPMEVVGHDAAQFQVLYCVRVRASAPRKMQDTRPNYTGLGRSLCQDAEPAPHS
jgi:hypothetical protein